MNERRDWAPADWSPMKRLIYLRGNPATGGGGGSPLTVSGPTPLLMPGAVAKPMRAAVFAISPVQAGTGDPSPSNVRPITGWTAANVTVTGKNLLNLKADEMEVVGWDRYFPFRIGAGTYTISCKGYFGPSTKYGCKVILSDSSKAIVLRCRDDYNFGYDNSNTSITFSVTLEEAKKTAYIAFAFREAGATFETLSGAELMLTPGETASPYTPYSGTTVSVEFPAMGNNLYSGTYLNKSNGIEYALTDTGVRVYSTAAGTYRFASFAVSVTPEMKGKTYTFNTNAAITSGACRVVARYVSSGTEGTKIFEIGALENINITYTFVVPSDLPDDTVIRFQYYATSNISEMGDVTYSNIQLEAGSSATAYEPYTNTVYSGTIDPVTGEGVVTHAKLNFDDFPAGYSWVYQSQYSRFYYTKEVAKGNGAVMSDIFKSGYDGVYTDNMGRIFIGSSTITDLETFTSTISGHYIVYELPTPIPFTVTPQTLTPPAGDAYIWADCGSTAEATYIGKP